MQDFIDQNIVGTWKDIKDSQIVKYVYPEFENLDWNLCYFALNVQRLDQIKIPTDCYKKIVISFHTEYFEHQTLWDFFNKNLDCDFLFLHDQVGENIWPANVTAISWNTWGHQLNVAIQHFGINNFPKLPTKKVSSLSNRHEFHKAAITAYLLHEFNDADCVVSWRDWRVGDLYYLKENFFIPDAIKKYLQHPIQHMELDQFENSPVSNVNWQHSAYLDAAINLTNESVFNSQAMINDCAVNLPTPYLTEKTWKPLLAGRPFIPVGQVNTLKSLQALGLMFDYGLDLSFDQCRGDFDRIGRIYQILDNVNTRSADEIFQLSYQSCLHNLDHIVSGKFNKNCQLSNELSMEQISLW